jgi:pentatricopeptide repeat protein
VVSVTAMVRALAAGGDADAARDLFHRMPLRDDIAWNAMITGYVRARGQVEGGAEPVRRNAECCASVGEVTLTSVLTACGQIGSLDHGKWVHWYMRNRGMRLSGYAHS